MLVLVIDYGSIGLSDVKKSVHDCRSDMVECNRMQEASLTCRVFPHLVKQQQHSKQETTEMEA